MLYTKVILFFKCCVKTQKRTKYHLTKTDKTITKEFQKKIYIEKSNRIRKASSAKLIISQRQKKHFQKYR